MRRITRPGSRLMRDLPFVAARQRRHRRHRYRHAQFAATCQPAAGPDDLLERMNTGEVTAAAEKTAPAGVVTVDKLESDADLHGPIIEIEPRLVDRRTW